MTTPVCIRFDHVRFKTRCELGQGRIAERDCLCSAYQNDPGYHKRALEVDKLRDAAWDSLIVRRQAAGL